MLVLKINMIANDVAILARARRDVVRSSSTLALGWQP